MTDLLSPVGRPYSTAAQAVEHLPFRVRLGDLQRDLSDILNVRCSAYGRHVPGMEEVLAQAEEEDFRGDAAMVVAECKTTGRILGSMRLITNLHEPLLIESMVTLPPQFHSKVLLEAWRLTVRPGTEGRMVTSALYKVLYEACWHARIDHILVVARNPVDRLYRAMQFKDAIDGKKITLSNTLALPHGLYYLPVQEADALWLQAACPLYRFMAGTHHPDIEVDYAEVNRRFHRPSTYPVDAVLQHMLSAHHA